MAEGRAQLRMGPAEWTTLAVLSLIWGGSFFFVEIALKELPSMTVAWLRVTIGAAVLWVFALSRRDRLPVGLRAWLMILIMGGLNNALPFSLFTWAQTHVESGLAAILNAATPLFGVMLAGLLLRDEPITPLRSAGVAIGFAGVVVLIGPSALSGIGDEMWAQLACLAAAACYAVAGIFWRGFARVGVAPGMAAAGQVTAASLWLTPLVVLVEQPWTGAMPGAQTWAAIAGLSLLSTGLALVLYFRLMAAAGATNSMLVTFLIPVAANLLGVTFLGESFGVQQLFAFVLIGLGLACIDGRLFQFARRLRAT